MSSEFLHRIEANMKLEKRLSQLGPAAKEPGLVPGFFFGD